MQLYCPSCQSSVTAADRCPECGDRLLTPSEAFAATGDSTPPPPDLIRPTAPARLIVGTVVALGLCLGLRDWLGAVAGDEAIAGVFTGGLKLLGVAVGGLLAGAGRIRGIVTGAIVGLTLAALFALANVVTLAELGASDLAFAATLIVAAALTGYLGGRVWPAPYDLPEPEPIIRGSSLAKLMSRERPARRTRPTAWAKLILGVLFVTCGVAGADAFRVGLKQATGGLIHLGGGGLGTTADLQLATMCILLGAAMAGSNTGAGFRHGLLVGLASCGALALLTVAEVSGPEFVYEGFLRLIGLSTAEPTTPSAVATVLSAVFVMCVFGGWLGGQLLPPLAPVWMRGRLIAQS